MFERHSALEGSLRAGGRDAAHGARQLQLTDVRGWHLAQAAVFRGHEGEFQGQVHACGGPELPVELYRGVTRGDSHLVRITPEQYWWIAGSGASIARLARDLPSSAGTVTLLSAGRVRVRVTGPAARELLAKGIALDLHPSAFQVGCSALTGLHHTGIFLERLGEDCYEIFLLRTYAEWIWDWLIDAALPFGYDLDVLELGAI